MATNVVNPTPTSTSAQQFEMPAAHNTKVYAQFTLTLNDFWKGLLLAVVTPVVTIVINSINAGNLTFDWKAIGATALSALLAYLGKNFFTPTQQVTKVGK